MMTHFDSSDQHMMIHIDSCLKSRRVLLFSVPSVFLLLISNVVCQKRYFMAKQTANELNAVVYSFKCQSLLSMSFSNLQF